MRLTSLKNKINKRIRYNNQKTDYTEIGAFIKQKRKELDVTQDVICNGICSVSYLSKIENGQILPNEFFVKEIIRKLDIEEDVLNKNLEDHRYLSEMIHHIFYRDIIKVKDMYQQMKDLDSNVAIELIQFGYYVETNHVNAMSFLARLENVVTNMKDIEIKIYLYFCATYFMKKQEFKTALELLLLNHEIAHTNEYVLALIHHQTYIVKQRLLKKNSSLFHYEEAQRIYIKYMNKYKHSELLLERIGFLSKENPIYALTLLQNLNPAQLTSPLMEHYYYLQASIYYKLNRFNESILSLNRIHEESIYYIKKLVLLYEICIVDHDDEMKEEIKQMVQNLKHQMFVEDRVYFNLLQQRSEQHQKEYLRDIAIPYAIKTSHYSYLKKFTDMIMSICINHSRYKEATQYYKKYSKELERVENILIA